MPALAAPAPSRAATCPPTAPAPKTVIFIGNPSLPEKSMKRESVRSPCRRQAILAGFLPMRAGSDAGWGWRPEFRVIGVILLIAALISRPAVAFDLFARHQVSVKFTTA